MANNVTDLGKVGITLKGEWNASTSYERLDAVTYQGSLYIAIKNNVNANPSTSTANWMLSAKHGEFTEQQLEDFKAEVVAESKEEMDDYTNDKKDELNTYTDTKETELNEYATELKNTFDTNASTKTSDFNDNATAETTAFNTNASDKTDAFDTNASTKTTAFDNNATSKTTAFNTNATNKTTDFNDNATAKTEAFDEHTEEIQADIEDLQNEVEELSANMPWNTTEQATEISVDDAAKYSKNKLELFGNTSQFSTTGVQLFDKNLLSQESNYNTYNSTTKLWTTNNGGSYGRSILYNATGYASRDINKLVPLTSAGTYTLKLYDFVNDTGYASAIELALFDNDGLKISQTTQNSNFIKFTIDNSCYMDLCRRSNSGTMSFSKIMMVKGDYTEDTFPDYEPYTGGQPSPNPDYPQDIHVVTGKNMIKVNINDDIVLPTGYKRLDYIENTGSEYIDTNFTPTDKTKIELDFEFDSFEVEGSDNYSYLYGARKASENDARIGLFLSSTRKNIRYDFYTHTYSTVGRAIPKKTRYKCTFDKTGVYLDDVLYGAVTSTYYNDEEFDTVNPLYIFYMSGTANVPSSIYKLYSFKIYESNVLIRHMIPCINPNNEIGLYDIVNNVFYGNQGTGSFIAGNKINEYHIDLGNIELCIIGEYKDYIYPENGNWYAFNIIKKYSYDGSKAFDLLNNCFQIRNLYPTDIGNIDGALITQYKFNPAHSGITSNLANNEFGFNTEKKFTIKDDRFMTANEFMSHITENPIELWYVSNSPTITQITDTTLIAQLDAIYEHLQLVKGTNNIIVTAEDLAPNMQLSYMQDLPAKLNNLASRIELLEE
ncbi:MAG: hypothetical protein IKE01_06675 [Clostridia bacterium]|nr:hypothetical protein [Clostridia bacterium]